MPRIYLNGNYHLYVDYNVTVTGQDVNANNSTIKVAVSVGIDRGWNIEYYNTHGSRIDIKVDGQYQSVPVRQLVLDGNVRFLGDRYFTVGHNDDGTKSARIEIGTTFNGISNDGLYSGNTYTAYDLGLSTIPRASDFDVPGEVFFGEDFQLTIHPRINGASHYVAMSYFDQRFEVGWSDNQRNLQIEEKWVEKIPNQDSTWFTIEVGTFVNGNQVGIVSKRVTIRINTVDFDVPSSMYFDDNLHVQLHTKSDKLFYHVLINYGSNDPYTLEDKGDKNSRDFVVPSDWATNIPQVDSTWFRVRVGVYNGNKWLGEREKRVDIRLKDSVKPTFDSLWIEELNAKVKDKITQGVSNTFVQWKSQPKFHFSNPKGTKGSWITDYYAEVINDGSRRIYENGGTLDNFATSGRVVVRARIKDSRGRWSDDKLVSLNVLPYFDPQLSYIVKRAGRLKDQVVVTRSIAVAPLTVNGRQKNTMNEDYWYKEEGGNFLFDKNEYYTSKAQIVTQDLTLSKTYGANKSYTLQIKVADVFGEVVSEFVLGTEKFPLSWSKDGIGVGKPWQKGALDVLGPSYLEGDVQITAGKTTIKDNWLDIRKGGLAVYDGEMWLNGKEIKSFEDIRMSDLYRSSAIDYICPDGTDLGEFLKSDKVKQGFSVIHDDNSGKWVNLAVIKENNKWVGGFGISFDGKACFVHVNNGIFTGYKYVNL